MIPVLVPGHRVSLLKNVGVPGHVMSISKLLDWSLKIAGVLDDAGYKYSHIVTSESGFILCTVYGREEVRFALTPVNSRRLLGTMKRGRMRKYAPLGMIDVSSTLVVVISDMDEAFPSLTLSLR